MNMPIRPATAADAAAISSLLHASFDARIAPDWSPEARQAFLNDTTAEKLSDPIAQATFAAVWEEDGQIQGVIVLPRPTLVQLCFVAPGRIRSGIGSALWEAARAHLEANLPDVKTVELNASPYAVPAYKAMGFYPISEPFRRNGTVATRMACWLPGRHLDKAAGAA